MRCAAATTRRPFFFFAGVKTPLHEILIKFLSCVRTLRARQEIRCAFWRERRAGRCEAPRRRRCRCASSRSGNKADARPPPRPSGLRPAGGVARSLHTAPAERGTHLTPRAFPRILGAWTFAVSTLAPSYWNGFKSWSAGIRLFLDVPCPVAFVAGWIGGRRTADCRR